MKRAIAVLTLLLAAATARAADPTYLDQLVETPLATLQSQFTDLKREACYDIGAGQFLLITMDKKDQKPWRVAVATSSPCRKTQSAAAMTVRERAGVTLGMTRAELVQVMGRPDATPPPDNDTKRFGDTEYFYLCRVSESCARHTSVFLKDGVVNAIAEWYSE